MSKYDPTTNGGETRTRTRAINLRTPLDSAYTVEILEQEVIRQAGNGEKVINDQAGRIGIADSAEEQAASFPMLNPLNDQPTGATATGAEFFQMVYSYVRAKQAERDAAGDEG